MAKDLVYVSESVVIQNPRLLDMAVPAARFKQPVGLRSLLDRRDAAQSAERSRDGRNHPGHGDFSRTTSPRIGSMPRTMQGG